VTPIAVVSNPRSEHNKRGMADIEACLAGRPGVIHVRFEPGMDLVEVTADLAARGTRLLVTNSGDGLVHGLLGALFQGGAFPTTPPLALLPRGMANMTAADVGLGSRGADTLARVLDAARRGDIERHLVRRRVLKIEYDPAKPAERGMFFGAAGIYDAVQLTTGRMHGAGLKGAWANAATLLTVLGRAVTRGVASLGLGGEAVGIGLDGDPVDTRPRALVLATTLDRLVLGSRPFWNPGAGPVHFTAFDHPAAGLVRHARRILYGGKRRQLPDPPYRSRDASRVELRLERPFTIDGEFFQAPPGSPVVVTAEEEVRFVKLRA
jgi:diacylglycerol kinase (ATP)